MRREPPDPGGNEEGNRRDRSAARVLHVEDERGSRGEIVMDHGDAVDARPDPEDARQGDGRFLGAERIRRVLVGQPVDVVSRQRRPRRETPRWDQDSIRTNKTASASDQIPSAVRVLVRDAPTLSDNMVGRVCARADPNAGDWTTRATDCPSIAVILTLTGVGVRDAFAWRSWSDGPEL